ncbi:hypothetical protein C5E06_06085 [Pseudoclavibacter sp. RFBI5]|uniref:hypothetical protein n=1 Tax=Pseudoclavibacter sp. RFBI5 TaxID=2080578 RepID=UPI000CE7D6A7|nr:hypothetical protein [Pseudoclavibacter sp. RFBI5]PPG03926.1 hypothetical protein C5E06_06085 [Pseudoclavibacter sp. RFBI5]
MSSSVVVVPRGHWISAWFLLLFAVPVVRVDDVDHPARWGQPTEITVEPGSHRVGVGARYHGTRSAVGIGGAESSFVVAEQQRLLLDARNGFFNHDPFRVTERSIGALR